MPDGRPWDRRPLPCVKGLRTWKQFFRMRLQTERSHFDQEYRTKKEREQQQRSEQPATTSESMQIADADGEQQHLGRLISTLNAHGRELLYLDEMDQQPPEEYPWKRREERNMLTYVHWAEYLRGKLPKVTMVSLLLRSRRRALAAN